MKQNLSIKEWAEDDRPREKAVQKGIASLSTVELLAILLGSGSGDESAIQLAQRILNSVSNNLNELAKLSLSDLIANFKGVGVAKGVTIQAAIELGKRRAVSDTLARNMVRGSRDVYDIFLPFVMDLPHEELWMACVNHSNQIVDKQRISQGGISETAADIRLILKKAISALATGIVLCHNHPSGSIRPSRADDDLTKRVGQAAKIMNIRLLDHLIIGGKKYYSYADEGKLD
ncbi:MAG TPA: hypothetical protein DDZ04_00115 [Parabacteroides sp.]|nr:hypothetical protein [Parabacteroides sp.]